MRRRNRSSPLRLRSPARSSVPVTSGSPESSRATSTSTATSRSSRAPSSPEASARSSVAIAGEVEGNIESAAKVELLSTGVINGDIKAGTLTVAAGSRMRGRAEFGWGEERPTPSTLTLGLARPREHSPHPGGRDAHLSACRAGSSRAPACPSCRKHLQVSHRATSPCSRPPRRSAWRPRFVTRAGGEAWEYSVVVTITNDRGEEVGRHIVGVGALQPGELARSGSRSRCSLPGLIESVGLYSR